MSKKGHHSLAHSLRFFLFVPLAPFPSNLNLILPFLPLLPPRWRRRRRSPRVISHLMVSQCRVGRRRRRRRRRRQRRAAQGSKGQLLSPRRCRRPRPSLVVVCMGQACRRLEAGTRSATAPPLFCLSGRSSDAAAASPLARLPQPPEALPIFLVRE